MNSNKTRARCAGDFSFLNRKRRGARAPSETETDARRARRLSLQEAEELVKLQNEVSLMVEVSSVTTGVLAVFASTELMNELMRWAQQKYPKQDWTVLLGWMQTAWSAQGKQSASADTWIGSGTQRSGAHKILSWTTDWERMPGQQTLICTSCK